MSDIVEVTAKMRANPPNIRTWECANCKTAHNAHELFWVAREGDKSLADVCGFMCIVCAEAYSRESDESTLALGPVWTEALVAMSLPPDTMLSVGATVLDGSGT